MVVPSYRHRAGKMEIENKKRQIKQELEEREKEFKQSQKPISDEEHKLRLEKLKEIGLLK